MHKSHICGNHKRVICWSLRESIPACRCRSCYLQPTRLPFHTVPSWSIPIMPSGVPWAHFRLLMHRPDRTLPYRFPLPNKGRIESHIWVRFHKGRYPRCKGSENVCLGGIVAAQGNLIKLDPVGEFCHIEAELLRGELLYPQKVPTSMNMALLKDLFCKQSAFTC